MSDADVKGALKGLYSRIIYSGDGKYLFLRNFVKHQKNFPLNEKNPAHRGIIKLLEEKLQTFNLQTINDYFQSPMQGASMGLQSPIGKGKGNGKGNNFSLVLSFLEEGFKTPFSEWLEYKKSRKESYKTQKSLEACYRKLKDLSGNDPVTAGKIVEQSLANNWAGLFELKGNKSGSGKYENLKNKYQKK
jgi:hypothetical protein